MDLIKTILTTTLPIIFTGLIAYISWLYQREKEKRISIQNQLSDKKYQVYIKIINLFFGLFEDTVLKKNETQINIDAKMLEIIKELTIYGSDGALKQFSYWKRTSGSGNKTPAQGLKDFVDILVALRKDMGHPKTKVNYDDVLGMMIVDFESTKKGLGL